MELDLFYALKDAFEISTPAHNHFSDALKSVSWDAVFYADGEHHFYKSGFTFTTPSFDPFEVSRNWMPSAIFSDGSCIEF